MYIFNGKKLTEDQAKKFAEETGRDLLRTSWESRKLLWKRLHLQ
jgi:hypothetical protein